MPDVRATTHAVWPGGSSGMGPHRVGAFANCPQYEAFAYELGLRPILRDAPTGIGALFHVAKAYWYAELLPERPPWFAYADAWSATRVCGADRPDLADEALRLFDAFVAKYPRSADPWRPALIEFQLWSEAEGEPYSTRLDLLAWEDGVGWILVNTKTAGRRGSAATYHADMQVLTEIAQARAAGYDVQRYYIDEVVKDTPPVPHRYEISVSPVAYERLARDTGYYLRERRRVLAEFPDPYDRPRNYNACRGRYRICDYYALCTGGLERLREFYQEERR